jgi:hypothetical protein
MNRILFVSLALTLLSLFAPSTADAYYAPHMGRWVNRDPIGYEGSQGNLYEYVESRPIDNTDMSGTSLDTGCPTDCKQQPDLSDIAKYGCYCGEGTNHPGPQPRPIDPLDAICQEHDDCYGNINPPCKGKTNYRDIGGIKIRVGHEPDPRPACRACDAGLCRGLNPSRCNRYGVGTPEYNICSSYVAGARLVFRCNDFTK